MNSFNSKLRQITKDELISILKLATYAPSVHNTQPWQVKLIDRGFYIYPVEKRILNDGDPIKRELWISLGCFVETAIVAAEAIGFKNDLLRVSEQTIKLTFTYTANKKPGLSSVIVKRFSDRSIFTNKTVSKYALHEIKSCWNSQTAEVTVTTDPIVISIVSNLTARGIGVAFSKPEFRHELASLITPAYSKKRIGISTNSLRYNIVIRLLAPYLVKMPFTTKWHMYRERKMWNSSKALVMTFSKGDTKEYWLEAGRAYQRTALTATKLGLRQSTSAAIVEAADFHTDIEELFGTKQRLQTLIRIGHSNSKPAYSPRLGVEDILIT